MRGRYFSKKIQSALGLRKPNVYSNQENKSLKQLSRQRDRVYILGTSENMLSYDLSQLRDEALITVGNFFEHPQTQELVPDLHVFAGSHPPITHTVWKAWMTRAHEVLPASTIIAVQYKDFEISDSVMPQRTLHHYQTGGTGIDFTQPVIAPWSVTVLALQLALYSGFKDIRLLGVNHDWQCCKPYRHFYDHDSPSLEYYLAQEGIIPSYEKQKQPFPKERLYKEYTLYQQYEHLAGLAASKNVTITNVDPKSHFDVFPKKPLVWE